MTITTKLWWLWCCVPVSGVGILTKHMWDIALAEQVDDFRWVAMAAAISFASMNKLYHWSAAFQCCWKMILLLVQVVATFLTNMFYFALFEMIWLELCCRILQQTRRICMWELPLPVGSWFWIMNVFTVVIYVTYMLYIIICVTYMLYIYICCTYKNIYLSIFLYIYMLSVFTNI